MIKGLENVEIKESWSWELDELEDQLTEARKKMYEIQKKIKLVKKERKLQPPLFTHSPITNRVAKAMQYQIISLEDDLICIEIEQDISESNSVQTPP